MKCYGSHSRYGGGGDPLPKIKTPSPSSSVYCLILISHPRLGNFYLLVKVHCRFLCECQTFWYSSTRQANVSTDTTTTTPYPSITNHWRCLLYTVCGQEEERKKEGTNFCSPSGTTRPRRRRRIARCLVHHERK